MPYWTETAMDETPRGAWSLEPVSSRIARWENMRKLVRMWQPPYHWPSVGGFMDRIAEIEQELDERHPGWHEPWAADLSRVRGGPMNIEQEMKIRKEIAKIDSEIERLQIKKAEKVSALVPYGIRSGRNA
jgi:hypothetical protein